MTRDTEALVIGGGPVGLFAALALLEQGVSIEVLDAAGERAVRGYACGLHPETLRILERVGLMPAVLEAGHRVDRLVVRRGHSVMGTADFGALGGGFPYALTLRQFDLEELLEQALARRGAPVRRHHSITQLYSRHGAVTVTGHAGGGGAGGAEAAAASAGVVQRTADYVIGADGYFSACRRALDVELTMVRPTRAFAVCEFNADLRGCQHEATVTFSGDSVSAFWPLGPELGRFTFEIWRDLDQTLSLDTLRALVRERAPWFSPQPEQLCWGAVAPFEHRLTRSFGRGRIWLAGDAAHATSPIGFQSMNRGFHEAERLAELIASALFDEDHRPQRFQEFEREQQAEWVRLFGLWTRAAEARFEPAELAPCIPASGEDFDALMAQLNPRDASVG